MDASRASALCACRLLGGVTGHRVDQAAFRHGRGVAHQPAIRPLLGADAHLEPGRAGAGHELPEFPHRGPPIARVHEAEQAPPLEFLQRQAQCPLPGRVHSLGAAVKAGDAQQIQRELEELFQLLLGPLPSMLRLHTFQRERHVGDEPVEQLEVLLVEKARLGGVQRDSADRAASHPDREASAGSVAALQRLLPPWRHARIDPDVVADRARALPGRGSRWAALLRLDGHGNPDALEVAVYKAGLGHRPERTRLVVHQPDPGHPEQPLLHRDAAHLLEQFVAVAQAHNRLADLAGNRVQAVQLRDPALGLPARSDVLGDEFDLHRRAAAVADRAPGEPDRDRRAVFAFPVELRVDR